MKSNSKPQIGWTLDQWYNFKNEMDFIYDEWCHKEYAAGRRNLTRLRFILERYN